MLDTEYKGCYVLEDTHDFYDFVLFEDIAEGSKIAVNSNHCQIDSFHQHIDPLQIILQQLYTIIGGFIAVCLIVGYDRQVTRRSSANLATISLFIYIITIDLTIHVFILAVIHQ